MSNEQDQILGHGEECDGIEEYDNDLPGWWVGLFIVSIIFAIGYTANYHFISQTSQTAQYQAQMDEAAALWPAPEGPIAVTDEMVAEGKEIYMTNCIGCHGPELKGGIGPDLTDAEWIHGGSLAEIEHTVTEGVPEKGMVAWGSILGPVKIQKVTAFVHSSGGGQ
ncbi:MAG: cbb3-type cytochrome c oxidase N-terminal domain-containing protein [Myxococcota bacterium]|nr:cbb3-type cytochrome c oxidase N-terminal domain-containing protein [Myxococcota bacterium]